MDALDEVAASHGLLVLEDAAQAAGARYRERRVGSLGAAAAFSFYPGKNLGALGDGGAVCTNDELLAARLRRLRNLGQRSKGEHVEVGYNERLDGLQAALLRVKLPHLDDWNEARRARADLYRAMLSGTTRLLEDRLESPCVYHLFPARFRDRDLVAEVLGVAGVQTGIHYDRAVHQHEAWADWNIQHGELPVAEAWAAEGLSLPMHPDLKPTEIEYVAGAIEVALARRTA
jgi:dTDP-4-amino-4,6-dideoxygalactose transaminase